MRRERSFKKSLLFLAVMSIMIFAMSITASASANNIKQTNGGESSVSVSWSGTDGSDRYVLYYSKTGKAGTYKNYTGSPTSLKNDYISGLNAGSTYYIKIETYKQVYTSKYQYTYKKYATSSALQVVTAPASIKYSDILQTAGTPTSVTVAWKKSAGASGYIVSKNDGASKAIAGNSIKVSASAGKHYKITVTPYKKSKSGFVAKGGYSSNSYILSAPSTPMYVANGAKGNLSWIPTNKRSYPTIYWNTNPNDYTYPAGYQVEVYTVDGKKKLSSGSCTSRNISITNSRVNAVIKNKGFKVRVRSYIKNDKAVCYSKWSAMNTIIPEASVDIKQTGSSTAKVTWPKVANATKYIIYVSKDTGVKDSGHWTKKTLSASTTSFTITGLKPQKDFGVFVIPVVKIGNKQYSAAKTWYTYSWISRYY